MVVPFRLLTTPGYERDVRKSKKRNPNIITVVERLQTILSQDPTNRSGTHDIKKLKAIPKGKGGWRIRSGNYRLRYDVLGHDVLLHAFGDRKEIY